MCFIFYISSGQTTCIKKRNVCKKNICINGVKMMIYTNSYDNNRSVFNVSPNPNRKCAKWMNLQSRKLLCKNFARNKTSTIK